MHNKEYRIQTIAYCTGSYALYMRSLVLLFFVFGLSACLLSVLIWTNHLDSTLLTFNGTEIQVHSVYYTSFNYVASGPGMSFGECEKIIWFVLFY